MFPPRQLRSPHRTALRALVPALLAMIALPAGAAAAPSVTGNLARTAPNDLRANLRNNGDAPLQVLQMQLAQPGSISGVNVVQGPPGTNCNTTGANLIGCQFQTSAFNPAMHQPLNPGQDLIIGFTTAQPYPDNGSASVFACPFPCSPGGDAGPFLIPGPQTTVAPPPPPQPQPQPGFPLPPGFDLFESDPTQTHFNFDGPAAIPPNVICPNCGGFRGDVHFGGVPLNRFGGFDSGDADTIVRRTAEGSIPNDGSPSAPIDIELVALSLVSIEPITVQTGEGVDAFFDVFVELSDVRDSKGLMTVRGNSKGGRFDSLLEVVPKFVFKRSDGEQTGVLDTGAFPRQLLGTSLVLQQSNGVWRRGCASPAQRIKGVNDVFCPGQTPGRVKRLTIEQAALARHGVYTVQPRLEHFACYTVSARRRIRSRRVVLRDQFARSTQRTGRHRELCNPARKNAEPWTNRRAHLQCYDLRRRSRSRLVAVRNQFGSQRLRTNRSRTLCVPSRKYTRRLPRNVTFTDHFQCYDLRRASFKARRVTLRDQFGRARVTVVRPIRLCTPTRKNNERRAHPVRHLVCYSLRSPRVKRRNVIVRNQFGRRQRVKVLRRTQLCVPSLKLRVR